MFAVVCCHTISAFLYFNNRNITNIILIIKDISIITFYTCWERIAHLEKDQKQAKVGGRCWERRQNAGSTSQEPEREGLDCK